MTGRRLGKVRARIVLVDELQGELLPLPDMPAGFCQLAEQCKRLAVGTVDTYPQASLEPVPVEACEDCARRYGYPLNVRML